LPIHSRLEQYEKQAGELPDLARRYDFPSWPALVEWVEAVTREDSPISKFESAVEAVITGDVPTLDRLLREHPGYDL